MRLRAGNHLIFVCWDNKEGGFANYYLTVTDKIEEWKRRHHPVKILVRNKQTFERMGVFYVY